MNIYAKKLSCSSSYENKDAIFDIKEDDSCHKWSVISLFSGCGGFDLGFIGGFNFLRCYYKRNPFDIIWANEINPSACKTYEHNIGSYIVNEDIAIAINHLPEKADIIIGGFPCQDISINGKMKGINGKRSGLYTYMVEAIKKVSPLAFIAENVGGLLLKQHFYSLQKILEDFSSLNYNVSYKLYNSLEYGVPRTRERVFIVGVKNNLPEFIPPLRRINFQSALRKQ